MEEDEQLEFFPYKDTVWGRAAYLLACLTSLQWLALYIVILLDFYNGCQVSTAFHASVALATATSK